MSTEIIKAPPVSDKDAFAKFFIEKGLQPYQVSYLIVGENKKLVQEALVKKELEAQKILLELVYTPEGEDRPKIKPELKIKDVEDKLATYRAIESEMTDKYRLPFTNFLKDNIINPLMEFEKRVDSKSNSLYQAISAGLIDLKKIEQQKAADNAKKIEEKQRWLAHIKNEILRIKTQYQEQVLTEVNTMYQTWLKGLIENPDIATLKEAVKDIKLSPAVIMQRQYLPDQEAQQVYLKWCQDEEFFQNDPEELLKWALSTVDSKFASYANDLAVAKNKPEIVAEIIKHNQEEVSKISEDAKMQTEVNDLVSRSTEVTPNFKPEFKPLKKSILVVPENTREFAINIMSIFISHPEIASYLSAIKEWKNLKIEQIATAIGKYITEHPLEKFSGLNYKEDQK